MRQLEALKCMVLAQMATATRLTSPAAMTLQHGLRSNHQALLEEADLAALFGEDRQGDFGKIRDALERHLAANPRDTDGRLLRAFFRLQAGQTQEAVEDLRIAQSFKTALLPESARQWHPFLTAVRDLLAALDAGQSDSPERTERTQSP